MLVGKMETSCFEGCCEKLDNIVMFYFLILRNQIVWITAIKKDRKILLLIIRNHYIFYWRLSVKHIITVPMVQYCLKYLD